MNAEWITALSSVVSLLIVTMSAVAALRQISHIRTANQSSTLLTLASLFNRQEATSARIYIARGGLDRFCDEHPDADIATMRDELEAVSQCLNILEIMGACVVYKIIDPAVMFGTLNVDQYWIKSERFIRRYRLANGRETF